MTIEEFEKWIEDYSKIKNSGGIGLKELLNVFQKELGEDSVKSIKQKIKEQLDKVEPEEDRNMLLLKYSDYLP